MSSLGSGDKRAQIVGPFLKDHAHNRRRPEYCMQRRARLTGRHPKHYNLYFDPLRYVDRFSNVGMTWPNPVNGENSMEPGIEYGISDYVENQEAFDALTDEQVQALARGETVKYGESEAAKVEAESSETPAAAAEPKEAVVESKPELLAKDGKHTIPYKELEDSREREAQWKSIAEAQTALAESLKTAKAEDKGTGETKAQDEVVAQFIEAFPELAESLQPAMEKMIDARVNASVAELEKKFAEAIGPMQKAAVDNSVEAHFKTIYAAVPDFDAIVDSKAIQSWVETLPSYVRKAAEVVLEKGSANEIIELFSDYKASLPADKTAEPVPSKTDIAAKAAAAIAKVKGKNPTSLSDVPAGTNAPIDADAAEAAMSPSQLYDHMMKMGDPTKILAHMSRVI